MVEIILQGELFSVVGCTDPFANNYDPTATTSCSDCCVYGNTQARTSITGILGCTDPFALNFNSNATIADGSCIYESLSGGGIGLGPIETGPIEVEVGIGIGFGPAGGGSEICPGPYSINTNNVVVGVTTSNCCNALYISGGFTPAGYTYSWVQEGSRNYVCKLIKLCPTNLTCVTCNNFNWWNNTYIQNHNGVSLQTTSPVIWQQLVNLVTNSGSTFYVETANGDLLTQDCCAQAQGTYVNGICNCTTQNINETVNPICISTIQQFLNFISTTPGYNFFVANFQTIGDALGLTPQQINFVLANINSTSDSNNNGIQDLTEARLILANALTITGGFHVGIGSITGLPRPIDFNTCNTIDGFWSFLTNTGTTVGTGTGTGTGSGIGFGPAGGGGVAVDLGGRIALPPTETIVVNPPIAPTPTVTPTTGQCMCRPVVAQCEIDITQVTVVSSLDFYNNTIQTVNLTATNTPLSEACCNRLIRDYNLPWQWQSPYCLAAPREDCLPIVFTLNDEPIRTEPCLNDLEISMWVYFAKPLNPCQPIPNPPDNDDPIVIDGSYCDITLTPNTGAIVPPNGGFGPAGGSGVIVDLGGRIALPPTEPIVVNPPIGTTSAVTTTCCYSTQNPITAIISLTDPLLNQFLTQVKTYNSASDYFDRWVQLKATLPTSGVTLNFGVNFEITNGLNCCCNYDYFIDDIKVNCSRQEPSLLVNNIKCPGFNLTKVIDNKKSWVYNPGLPSVGISEYDNIERADGSFGMLDGEGTINRTFAPSLDADIPWRYTDYFNQSSVLEKHSNLVLNSKELWLTFDMCATCPISGTTLACPSGYTLSASTIYCYNISGNTTTANTVTTLTYLSLYDLENYKKQFQSFWIPFMEQFIPATTIWVAGERWCNIPCPVVDTCKYDFEFTESDIIVQPIPSGIFPQTFNPVLGFRIPDPLTSTAPDVAATNNASNPSSTPQIVLVQDLGLTTTIPNFRP